MPLGAQFYNFQPRHITVMASNFPPPKFRNFTYLYYLAFFITWPFCFCCYEHGGVLLSRWSL